ncbi:unnamed protein product [Fusarium venenatum]|uniref:Uncharacterized protein n=1 Tax=Fusarium venenatum TaxID=56646 RepID=A0A2L2TWA1_9HYPO|nr:uncharacterized protein FVRRES_01287 [Fusarium venenatum]CEI64775.1 unnamed protein product [Fusarium venenatum]
MSLQAYCFYRVSVVMVKFVYERELYGIQRLRTVISVYNSIASQFCYNSLECYSVVNFPNVHLFSDFYTLKFVTVHGKLPMSASIRPELTT